MNFRRPRILRSIMVGVMLSVLALVTTFGLVDPWLAEVQAQQTIINVPISGSGFPMALTGTTTASTTAIAPTRAGLKTTDSGNTGGLFGSHPIYGYRADGVGPCFVQVFDNYPTTAVTVGTTAPIASLPIMANSALGFDHSPLPLFTIDSALVIAATTTPLGSTACASAGAVVTFQYAK